MGGGEVQEGRSNYQTVLAGLVPAIPIRRARRCPPKRDGRDEPGHDSFPQKRPRPRPRWRPLYAAGCRRGRTLDASPDWCGG